MHLFNKRISSTISFLNTFRAKIRNCFKITNSLEAPIDNNDVVVKNITSMLSIATARYKNLSAATYTYIGLTLM